LALKGILFVTCVMVHVLRLQLSPPPPSSLAPVKPANPGSPGKMAVKMERNVEGSDVRVNGR